MPPNDSRLGDEHALDGLAHTQRTVRGLFTGGTFCYEAQLAFLRRGLPCRSNAPVHGAMPLDGSKPAITSSSTWATTSTRAGGRTR